MEEGLCCVCVTGEATCFVLDLGEKQFKCLIAIFRTAFILKKEKSENIKIHRNDSKRIGSPSLRMNYEF